MKKRFVSWLLVLCMILTMLPMSAFAADEESPAEPSAEAEVIDVPEETPEVSEAPEEVPEDTPEVSVEPEEAPEETPAEEPEETPEAEPEVSPEVSPEPEPEEVPEEEPEEEPEDALDLEEDPDESEEPEIPEEEPEVTEDEPDEPEELDADVVDSGTCGDNLTWSLDSDGTLTISGTGAMTDFSRDDCRAPWYSDWSSITAIEVEGATHIGDWAFWSLCKCTSVTLSNSVTSIGYDAFQQMQLLETITIPNSVTTIGYAAFWKCNSLKTITIPESVTSIGSYAFYDCYNLTSVTIPSGITSIESGLFYGCSKLTSITIPDGVTSIGIEAFRNCGSLTSIVIPDNVTIIGGQAFMGCSLTSIAIPDSVTTIESEAFEGCHNLTAVYTSSLSVWCRIKFGNHDTNPLCNGGKLYVGGVEVSELVIPSSITSIGDYAFEGCNLTSVTIPNTVTSIGKGAFRNCQNLTSVIIPSSVTNIGAYAFLYCYSLSSVIIPSSVTSIGTYAFSYCRSLTSITIPSGVTSIGQSAFESCSSLTSVTLPESLTSIGKNAFLLSSLKYVFYAGSIEQKDALLLDVYETTLPEAIWHYNATGHSWDSGKVTTAATYTAAGVKTYTCSVCGATKTASIPKLTKVSLSSCTVTLGSTSMTYTGSALKPAVTVKNGSTTVASSNYTVAYSNNTNVGTATVTITGKDNYTGTKTANFKITAKSISGFTAALGYTSATYTGSALQPAVTLKNGSTTIASSNYTLAYSNNTNVGTATVTITGKGNYAGTKTASFKITAKSISGFTAALGYTSATYTGSALQPAVTLKNGSAVIASANYTVAYANNVNPGIATVTITGKGNYAGTLKKTFTIAPKASKISTLTNTASGVKIKWTKVANATGYYLYRGTSLIAMFPSASTLTYTDTAAKTNGKKYVYKVYAYKSASDGSTIMSAASAAKTDYFLSKPTISSAKNGSAGKVAVKWGANSAKSGYEIQYSTSSTFKTTATITAYATSANKTLAGLTKGKTYYIRVRTYKTVSGTKYYSAWSASKSVKIKK